MGKLRLFKKTATGRIVYRRKVHVFKAWDLLRILESIEVDNDFTAGQLAAAFVLIHDALDVYSGDRMGILSLVEKKRPAWFRLLDEQKEERWATEFNQKYPLRSAIISITLEAWRAYQGVKTVEKFKPGLFLPPL